MPVVNENEIKLSGFFFILADKPKVYQGVRVKTTVKELLQKHRALQAQKTATVNNGVEYQ